MTKILVVTTGGTMGALPVEDVKKQPHIKDMPLDRRDFVGEALACSFARWKTRIVSLAPRDSRFIDEAYRAEIAAQIEASPERRVLITHGTDTLLDTADFFYRSAGQNAGLQSKFIIVTGAMVPLANGRTSDGYRNIEHSLNCLLIPSKLPSKIGVVLCGFETLDATTGDWRPRYYPYEPGKYEKFVHPTDNRFSRLKVRQCRG
jgi:L-asparaginase